MAWIKRNLIFAIGALVALALMGGGVWYLLAKMKANKETQQQLDEAYAQLDTFKQQQGGDDKIVEEQIRQLREISNKFRAQFKPIPSIPNTTNLAMVTTRQFATALPGTIAELQRAAAVASVSLPPQFAFSFGAQLPRTQFAPGSLGPLSVQLGEVKAICDVLFAAKINSLDSIRRERVSPDDEGGQGDYLEKKSLTTEMSTLTPYEISFRCFGAELSGVLMKLASSPYCFVVESVNVDPAEGSSAGGGSYSNPEAPASARGAGAPPTAAATTVNKGGLPTFLDEKQIRVTLALQIVKLNSKR